MQKKIASVMRLQKHAGVSTAAYENRERYQLALTRPKWAKFRMEGAFWSALEQICEHENMTGQNFVALATEQRPSLLAATAVRLGIIEYYKRSLVLPPVEAIGSSLGVVSPYLNRTTAKVTVTVRAPGPLHVLIVDDVAMNRDFAGSILRAAGHEATCVEGGAEAIAAVKATDYDVVLMDVRMPEIDGLEATRLIRKLAGARGRVPIVALTARAFTEQVAECLAAGMDSHLAKPFTPEALVGAALDAVGICPTDERSNLVSTGCSKSVSAASVSTPPVIYSNRSILDQTAFQRTAHFLSVETIDTYVREIAERAEALLSGLSVPAVAGDGASNLADAASALAGSAGMFGFDRLSYLGCCFERAVEADASDRSAIAGGLRDALQDTLSLLGSRRLTMVEA